jgi:hypothetical protein
MAAASVPLLASGLSRGESPAAIIASTAGGFLVNEACDAMVESLVKKPASPVDLTIATGSTEVEKSVTVPVLTQRAPSVPRRVLLPGSSARMLECDGWTYNVLWRMCVDGLRPILKPRGGPADPSGPGGEQSEASPGPAHGRCLGSPSDAMRCRPS